MDLYIFDFYGVVSSEIAPPWFRKHFDIKKADELKNKYFIPADMGEYDVYEIAKKISNELNISYEEILKGWKNEAILNTRLLEFILKLKENNKTALLSNAAVGFNKFLYPNLDLSLYFDKVYISGYEHMIKPNIAFYNKCVDSFNYEFENIYMIDDNIKNLEVLKETKIQPILFKNNQDVYSTIQNKQ